MPVDQAYIGIVLAMGLWLLLVRYWMGGDDLPETDSLDDNEGFTL